MSILLAIEVVSPLNIILLAYKCGWASFIHLYIHCNVDLHSYVLLSALLHYKAHTFHYLTRLQDKLDLMKKKNT